MDWIALNGSEVDSPLDPTERFVPGAAKVTRCDITEERVTVLIHDLIGVESRDDEALAEWRRQPRRAENEHFEHVPGLTVISEG